MRTFEGYQRKALIIVPKHDVYKQRLDKRIKEQGRDIPDYAVIEMKGEALLKVLSCKPTLLFCE